MKGRLKGKQNCSYWSAKDRSCTLRTSGLFIPSNEHIIAYCTTAKHPNCLQYKLKMTAPKKPKKTEKELNRRKYSRFSKKLPVTLLLLNNSGNVVRQLAGSADTIDLSLGGMQLTTDEPLTDDSIINFSFGDSYPDTLQSGLAKVRWYKYKEESPFFTAGLAFHTEQTIEAISSCFGLSPQ